MNAEDLIAYWSRLGQSNVHPDDRSFIDGQKFATALHPVPWVGPIKHAKSFLLFLNPGLSDQDEAYEANNPAFVQMLNANLRDGCEPYFYLLERFAEHPGYSWARTTFGPDIREPETKEFCVLQLVAYHSKEGADARRIAPKLPSSTAVRHFVRDDILPRAQARAIDLIVARSARLWEIDSDEESDRVVIYRDWECRRALQTKDSRGGRLLRRTLLPQPSE